MIATSPMKKTACATGCFLTIEPSEVTIEIACTANAQVAPIQADGRLGVSTHRAAYRNQLAGHLDLDLRAITHASEYRHETAADPLGASIPKPGSGSCEIASTVQSAMRRRPRKPTPTLAESHSYLFEAGPELDLLPEDLVRANEETPELRRLPWGLAASRR